MKERSSASWLVYALAVLCAGAIVAAILVVGPASGSQVSVTRTATVARGVVQSTVSGSGNLQAVSQLNLGFKTSGTITRINVKQGQQVIEGQLLAELDPESAEVTLEQAQATLQAAEANLAKEEETDGEGSSGSGGGTSNASDLTTEAAGAREASFNDVSVATTASSSGDSTNTPSATPQASGTSGGGRSTSTAPSSQTTPSSGADGSEQGTSSNASESAGTSSSSAASQGTVSAATREANLASARAQVRSDALTVQSDAQAVQDTKLYAAESGTIVSLAGQVGEVVSASGTTRASSASSSAESSSGASASTRAGSGASSSATGSSSTSSSSSSAFAVLSDLSSMDLVVPLSESEIGSVKKGQIATVTVEALGGRKLAAHVREVAILATSNSGVVSYDVTFQLDQMEAGLRPGMSASAEVVVKQAEGINVPSTALSAGSVTVVRNGKHIRQRVVTGLAGNSSTIILSGLKAGETVVLPTLTTSTGSSSGTSRLGRLGGGAGAGGLGGGGGFPGGAGGGAAFFRGGG
jgi:multidrug efflux pump subunit AcrA (membrane-fusion protein)